jgi:hypothetical protein
MGEVVVDQGWRLIRDFMGRHRLIARVYLTGADGTSPHPLGISRT